METNTKTTPEENDNIFYQHFVRFAFIGIICMFAFAFFNKIGWDETAAIILFTTPCYIPNYLMRIRAERNKAETTSVINIGILSLILFAAGIILILSSSIEEKIEEEIAENVTVTNILSAIWLMIKIIVIQALGIFSGTFPKPPSN